jgi:protein-tyrosine sulfotransferase
LVDDDGENLVFLFSTPRAGSTLTSAILSTHPDVLSPNEPWVLLGLASLYDGANNTHARYDHGLFELALREFISQSEFCQAARSFAITVYNQALGRENKRIFIDKTPRYYHITEFVDQLFPRAKKVWLKRNPLDVVASYRDYSNVAIEKLFDPEFGPISLDLPLGLQRLSSLFRGRPLTFEFCYEDLVAEPAKTVRQLCSFMNVEYVEGMELYGSNPTALARRKSLSMGDRNFFSHSQPHCESVGRWYRSLSATEIQMAVNYLGQQPFLRMGYQQTVEQLTNAGFSFPSEDAVADRLSAFVDSARSLAWTSRRERDLVQRELILAETDRALSKREHDLVQRELDFTNRYWPAKALMHKLRRFIRRLRSKTDPIWSGRANKG